MLINTLGVQNVRLIQRIDQSRRNKLLDSSVINLSSLQTECKMRDIKLTKTLDKATNLISSTKRLIGVLIVQKKHIIVATNDIIEYKNHKYTIQVANPLEEEKKVLVAFNKYYIEALG